MKDSKQYSQNLQKLYRSLTRKYRKPKKVTYDTVVDALVYATISENISETAAQSAMSRLNECFVDLNDLRVSRTEEILEMLGEDTPVTRNTALLLSRTLTAIFNKHHTVSLEALKKIGKRSAKQVLEKIDGTTCFVVNYCMLTALGGHAIPLTKNMIEYLKNQQMVHPEADQPQIEGFLARQISAKNAYEFYVLLRRQSESRRLTQKKTKKRP
jgi:endonuclease III